MVRDVRVNSNCVIKNKEPDFGLRNRAEKVILKIEFGFLITPAKCLLLLLQHIRRDDGSQ